MEGGGIRWRHIGAISRRTRQTSTAVIMIMIVDCIVVSAEHTREHTRDRAAPRSPSESRARRHPRPTRTLTPAGRPANRPPPRAADRPQSHVVADGIGAVLGRDARPTTYSRHLSDDGAQSRRPLTHIWESSWTELRGRKNVRRKECMYEKWQRRKMQGRKTAWTKNDRRNLRGRRTAWTKICTDEKIYERKNARTKKYRTKKWTDEKIYERKKYRRKIVQTKIYPYEKLPDENLGDEKLRYRKMRDEKMRDENLRTKKCQTKNGRDTTCWRIEKLFSMRHQTNIVVFWLNIASGVL